MKALMYHYVREFDPTLPGLKFLHIKDFKKQLNYLASNYGFVSRNDFIKAIKGEITCPKGIVLTFDDGLKDHFKFVLPELLRNDLWGIFYISTGVLQNQRTLSVHVVHFLLAKYGAEKILKEIKESDLVHNDLFQDEHYIHESKIYLKQEISHEEYIVKKILNYSLKRQEKEDLCSYLMSAFGEDERVLHNETYLTLDEIQEMNKSGMIIGSHAISHQPMVELNDLESSREIEDSVTFIESNVNPPLSTFCYPHGLKHTFSLRETKTLQSLKVDFSFAVESRDILDSDLKNDIHSLPRYDCNEFNYGKVYNANSTS